jgi:hypothetical protein
MFPCLVLTVPLLPTVLVLVLVLRVPPLLDVLPLLRAFLVLLVALLLSLTSLRLVLKVLPLLLSPPLQHLRVSNQLLRLPPNSWLPCLQWSRSRCLVKSST